MESNRELAGWISGCLAGLSAKRVCLLDGGTAKLARRFKAQNLSVRAVDSLQCHHFWHGALLPDGPAQISEAQAAEWMRLRKEPDIAGRFFGWANDVFSPEEAVWLGIWRSNILESGLPFRQQALGSVVVMRTMAYWLAWNRSDIGHKPLPPAAVFRHYVDETNREITQSGIPHEAVYLPAGQDPDPGGADLVYCYVPPMEGMKAMDRRLPYWERWILGDPAAPLPFEAPDRLGGVFADEESRLEALKRLLGKMVDVPVWALAYAGDGDSLVAAVTALRPNAVRHEIQVPYPDQTISAIMNEGLIVASHGAPRDFQSREARGELAAHA